MADKVAAGATYAGSGTAVLAPVLNFFGLTPADVTILVQVGGFWIGAGGLYLTYYFKQKEHQLALAKARAEGVVIEEDE